jgi:chromosome segregation ATPase
MFLILVVSCNSPELENKVKTLEQQNRQLQNELQLKDSLTKVFGKTIQEIDKNIQAILTERKAIQINVQNNLEHRKDVEQSVIEKIQLINSLLYQNEKLLDSLSDLLAKNQVQMVELKSTINILRREIEQKNNEIAQLKQELVKKNFKIEDLNRTLDSLMFEQEIQQEVIAMQSKEISTAYYCIGSKKELLKNNIISKEGGVIGLGKTMKLSDDFNQEYFTEINIFETQLIPVFAKKAEVLTTHPSESYKFIYRDDIVQHLEITNPKSFWKASKYLVIETK